MENKNFFSLENLYRFLDNKWGQFFLITILVFIIFIPIFLSNKIFLQGDTLALSYPDLSFYQQSIKSNANFLWNPFILSGFPTFLGGGGQLSFLFYFLTKISNFLFASHFLIFLSLILAGYLTTRLLVHFGISSIPALIGGISYILSSMSLLTDLIVVGYLPCIPAIIWLLIICYEKNSWKPVFGGILLVFLILVSVHYNWQLFIFTAGLIVSLFYPWIKNEVDYRKYLILIVKYFTMLFFGFLLALPLFFPLFNYLPYSYRGSGLSYGEAAIGSAKILDFINFVLPFSTPPFFSAGIQFYFGILALFFVIFSFVLFKRQRLVKFFSLIFIFIIIIAIKYSPIFWLMQKIPILNIFRVPSRWMALGFFAASILAGIGAENFLKPDFEKYRIKLVKIFKWAVLFIILFSLIFNVINYFFGSQILSQAKNYFDQNLYQKTTGLPLDHYHLVIDQKYANIFNLVNLCNPKFLFPLLILIISYLAIEFFLRKKQRQNFFYIGILIVVIANFFLILPLNYQLVSRHVFNYQPKIAKYVSNNPGKIFSFLPGFSEFNKLNTPYKPKFDQVFIFQSELLPPNLGTFYNIKSADGFSSLMPKKHSEILALLGSDRTVAGQNLSNLDIPLEDKIRLFRERLNLINMLGIKYITSVYQIEDENLEQVFKTESTDYKIPIYLYQIKKSLPEIYFARSVDFLTPKQDKENLQIIIKEENDFNKKTFIECLNCTKTGEPSDEIIQIIQEKNGYLRVKTSNKNAGWLIFNQSKLPGWQAKLDSDITPIYNANYLFQAIFIPLGEHEIIFKYNPFAIEI